MNSIRICLLALFLGACGSFVEKPRHRFDDREAQKRAVSEIRSTGTAMVSWQTDRLSGALHPAEIVLVADRKRPSIDWRKCPTISLVELREELVPRYIHWIPDRDPWGRPYEFCLDRGAFDRTVLVGIRSAGRDRVFETDVYTIGPFDPDDFDQDIVWVDGNFVRWPQEFPVLS